MAPTAAPRIRYLNGLRFRRALIAGARRLIDNRDRINSINVFPVADRDTGSNMAGTLGFIVNGINASRERAMHRMLRSVADLALSGARGCSGTILAQFFHGLAQELTDSVRVGTRGFGRGVRRAVAYPWDAVSQPREGTILTMLRDWGDTVYEWSERTDDFVELLQQAYRRAAVSLERTRDTLAVLTLAGVVDAGAQGLVHLLAGITQFIAAGRIGEMDKAGPATGPEDDEVAGEAVENPEFRYCTQFVMEDCTISIGQMRDELSAMGNALIVAGSPTRAKIHIHSNTPALVFQRVVPHGNIAGHRVEDMRAQYRAAHVAHPRVAIAVDSACDLPAEVLDEHTVHVILCLLRLGGRTYLDKFSITPSILFSLLRSGGPGGARAAVIGHIWTVFARFHGGRGVATAAGMLVALYPLAVLVSAGVFGLVLISVGIVSVASLTAALLFPFALLLLDAVGAARVSPLLFWFSIPIVLLIFATHRANIGRLLHGTENRFPRLMLFARLLGKA